MRNTLRRRFVFAFFLAQALVGTLVGSSGRAWAAPPESPAPSVPPAPSAPATPPETQAQPAAPATPPETQAQPAAPVGKEKASNKKVPGTAVPVRRLRAWRDEWPRASTLEHIVAVVLGAGTIFGGEVIAAPDARWKGGILFDEPARDVLRLHNVNDRTTAAGVSDALFYMLSAYPVFVDSVLLTGPADGDLAWQLFIISGQSLAVSGFLSVATERLAGRQRPFVRMCAEDPDYHADCTAGGVKQNVSFVSGHTLMAFTGAGLICAHHTYLPLYGGGLADDAACVLGMVGATTSGVLRVLADKHYVTDVLVGAGIGLLSGYMLPVWAHYGRGLPSAKPRTAARVSLSPMASGSSLGVAAMGIF